MKALRVHYIGSDPDFIKSIQGHIEALKLSVTFSSSIDDVLIVCTKMSPSVIYVDFTTLTDSQLYIDQIIYLKKIPHFKPILFVGLLSDEVHLKNLDHIFASGIQLSFIKGGEYESLFRDSLFIAADERISYPQYALAEGLYQKITAGICSTITELSVTGLTLETDLEINGTQISLSQKICPGNIQMDVVSDQDIATDYPLLTSYELEFPVLDSWTDDHESALRPETIETWLELNQDQFIQRKEQAFVIDSSFEHIKEAFDLGHQSKIGTGYFEKIEDAIPSLNKKFPSLIFIEVGGQDENPNSMGMVEVLLQKIRANRSYYPVLILTNVASSSIAVQKFMDYSYVVCYSGKIYEKLIETFSELYLKKKVLKTSSFTYAFSSGTNFRVVDVNFNVVIRQMTENQIVFRCEEELPMFTVLHFHLPIEFYGTLVPTKERNPESRIYTAIIHGVSEKRLELMRQFIYALIANPDIEFKIQEEEKILELKEADKVPRDVETTGAVHKLSDYKQEEKKVRYSGKSKL